MRKIDLSGNLYNSLFVIEKDASYDDQQHWKCECLLCGKIVSVRGDHLKNGEIRTCGCEHHSGVHGKTETRLYHIWCTMKSRCMRPTNPKYRRYGARGIKLCEEWKDFMNFYNWSISHGYRDDLSIDRINNDGNYEPSNCRWATSIEQANNTSTTIFLTYKGKRKNIKEWSNETGISRRAIYRRYKSGWSIEDILTKPLKNS